MIFSSVIWYKVLVFRGAAIFTTSKYTAAVCLAKSVKKWMCFCHFQFEVYNWQITPTTLSYSQFIVIFTPMQCYKRHKCRNTFCVVRLFVHSWFFFALSFLQLFDFHMFHMDVVILVLQICHQISILSIYLKHERERFASLIFTFKLGLREFLLIFLYIQV